MCGRGKSNENYPLIIVFKSQKFPSILKKILQNSKVKKLIKKFIFIIRR